MSRLLPRRFFALVPIPELRLTNIATGARPSCDTRPGLRSRPLGRRSGCSSAEPYPPPRPFFNLSRLSFTTSRTARENPDCLATRNRRSQSARSHTDKTAGRDASERRAAAKPMNTVPFPLISIAGTGTTLPRNQSSRCQPAAVRLNRPARSSDSSTSPRRSFLTATQSRSFDRVSTMPPAKLSSTRSSRLCGFPSVCLVELPRAGDDL